MTASAREILLRGIGEEEFARQVKRWAYRAGYCGYHIRYSHAVVEGVHTLRNSDHNDAYGFPDWIFGKPNMPLILAELKRMGGGRPKPAQRRWLELLNQMTGVTPAVWRPDMEREIMEAFRKGG